MKKIKIVIFSLLVVSWVTLPHDANKTFSDHCLRIGKKIASGAMFGVAGAMIRRLYEKNRLTKLPQANSDIAQLVRTSLNIPNSKSIDVQVKTRLSEESRAYLCELKMKSELSALSAVVFAIYDGSPYAQLDNTVVINSVIHDLLLHPEYFKNEQEYQKFMDIIEAVLQHEGAHLHNKDATNRLLFLAGACAGISLAGECLKSSEGEPRMSAAAIVRGLLSMGTLFISGNLHQRSVETRADNAVEDDRKKDLAKYLHYASDYYLDASLPSYNRENVWDLLLATHPHSVTRIERLWGIEECADYVITQEIEKLEQDVQKLKEDISAVAAKTEQEKIEYCIKAGNCSPDVTTWKETADEILSKYPPILDTLLADKRARREEEKQKLIAQMRDSISLTNNFKRLPRELAFAGVKRVKQWLGKKEENKKA